MGHEKKKRWDEVILYKGIGSEIVKLDNNSQLKLSELIYEFEYLPIADITMKENTNVYGGNIYNLVFTKKNITHKWKITDTIVEQTIYEDDIEMEKKHYESSIELIEKINIFITKIRKEENE